MLGKSSVKWRQRFDMIIAVDWDVKHQFKQTKECSMTSCLLPNMFFASFDLCDE